MMAFGCSWDRSPMAESTGPTWSKAFLEQEKVKHKPRRRRKPSKAVRLAVAKELNEQVRTVDGCVMALDVEPWPSSENGDGAN